MPPRRRTPTGPKPVESITHGDKRTNLPTADAQEFVTPDVEATRRILVDRNSNLDPQMVWRGKYGDETAAANLIGDAEVAEAGGSGPDAEGHGIL